MGDDRRSSATDPEEWPIEPRQLLLDFEPPSAGATVVHFLPRPGENGAPAG